MKLQAVKARLAGKITQAAAAFAAASLVYLFLPGSCPEPARRMAFIFVIAALFWALEIIPLFATALMIVVLEIFFLAERGNISGLSYTSFLTPFSNPIIMLFLGGFVLARALQKYGLDRRIAARLLRFFGSAPAFVLLGFMAASAFLSLWISNTASTAIMLAMIHPVVASSKPGDPFRKALVLGVAFGAVIGGIATPVGSPPNALAIGFLAQKGIRVDFLSWMRMALPLAVFLLLIMSALLYRLFPSRESRLFFSIETKAGPPGKSRAAAVIALLLAALWLSAGLHHIPEAVSALLGVCLFAVFGLIDVEDMKSIEWDILLLMWGGLALGYGMEASGLAGWLVSQPFFLRQGYELIVLFALLSVLLSTFISNTATVNLLIPIALSIPGQNPVQLAVVIALASSFDIALPISTPPMAMAYGTREVPVKEMLKAGLAFTFFATAVMLAGFEFVLGKTLLK